MKNGIIFASAAALLLASCASISEPKLLKPFTKVALVAVTANPQLYYVGDQPPQADLLGAAVNVAANQNKDTAAIDILGERTAGLVAKADELLIAALGGASGLSLVSKADLVASNSYRGLDEVTLMSVGATKPQGYKFLKPVDAGIAGVLANDLGVNGVVVASFLFQKSMSMGMMGTGSLGATVGLNVQVFDKAGVLVFAKGYTGVSKGTVGIVANVYDLVKYPSVLTEAAQIAISKFADDLAAR